MKTLIQRQESCIARMSESRTSERRAAKNRAAAIAGLRKQCGAVGYSAVEINGYSDLSVDSGLLAD
jgi:hypothetical protein